jgi:hypothetical protein
MINQITDLRINLKARDWCKLSYPDHPKGCPNYGQRDICPPDAPLINDYFDLSQPLYLISVSFNIAEHINNMLTIHPDWSLKQAKCVLYWQGSIKKKLKIECEEFIKSHPKYSFTICPEAMGVNVITTAQRCDIAVKVKPDDIVYKIAFAGVLNGKGNNSRVNELLPVQMPLLLK